MINFTNGFLPAADPLRHLPTPFDEWEAIAPDLFKLALTNYIRTSIDDLPPFPTQLLQTEAEFERAMTLLSYMAALYVYAPSGPLTSKLPRNLAMALHTVSQYLSRPPILSYASQALYNWRRIDPRRPIIVGNLTLIQNFLGGQDEEWFVTIHVSIEAVAGKALAVLLPSQMAVTRHDISTLINHLQTVTQTIAEMQVILRRMTEKCDPYIYYHRVRPFMFGWKDNPALPQGMIYDGVYGNRPQQFRGETGAQSSIIPALDAFLGIQHEYDEMRAYLAEMREYMPRPHREFIAELENGCSLRQFVIQNKLSEPILRSAYNDCLAELQRFRQLHIEYAALYILKPAQGEKQGDVGTGGTPFTVYLKKHIRETADHKI